MKTTLFTFTLIFFKAILVAQERYIPQKINDNEIVLDGIIKAEEWKGAIEIDLDFEVNPGSNIDPQEKTTAYVLYTDTHLYLAFYAYADS